MTCATCGKPSRHHGSAEATTRSAYPVNEGCYKLGICRSSLYEMAKDGKIKLIKIAGRTLVPHSEIERLTSPDRAA